MPCSRRDWFGIPLNAKKIVLCNNEVFPCPGAHGLHSRRFLRSFEAFDYRFVELTSSSELSTLGLSHGDVIYISDHGLHGSLTEGQLCFLEAVRAAGILPVFWSWFGMATELDSIFNGRWLLTGEKYRAQEVLPSYEKAAVELSRANGIPLSFAATIDPKDIGRVARQSKWNVGYVGARYHVISNFVISRRFSGVKIQYTPPFVDEEYRISFYTNSKSVLGWHSPNNRRNGVVGERVFEGLAYGAIVITDNPYALEATEGNVLFADGLPAAIEHIDRVLADEKLRNRMSTRGMDWARSYGTYSQVAKQFVQKITNI